jgi:hypothetical protein
MENKNSGHVSQGACRQDELTGGKPPVVVTLTLTLTLKIKSVVVQVSRNSVQKRARETIMEPVRMERVLGSHLSRVIVSYCDYKRL